uniref:BPTI/Kunitz inhibitor domain-containing protein n=1 Tax=Timema douglasi TaxID=61478 RepID=A0A7R8VU10_TIMDO|nr:unnamed protein product [Timema douglasi]
MASRAKLFKHACTIGCIRARRLALHTSTSWSTAAEHTTISSKQETGLTRGCSEPPETGLCKAYFPRYYYDNGNNTCYEFVYGGCGGNCNNYEIEKVSDETLFPVQRSVMKHCFLSRDLNDETLFLVLTSMMKHCFLSRVQLSKDICR